MNAKIVIAIILGLLFSLADAVPTDANDTPERMHSAASVRFVIHIPETLKLSINSASMLRHDLKYRFDNTDSVSLDHSSLRPPLVEAIGRLTHGSTMALTADANTSRSQALAMMTWTASGMAITGGHRSDVFIPKDEAPELHAYCYRKTIPSEFVSRVSALNYILCSP